MDMLAQRLAVNKLHGDEWQLVARSAYVVDRADSRMIQSGSCMRFATKTFQCHGILRHILGQEFQRHRTLQPRVVRLINHTHPAGTEFLQNAIVRNGSVNHERAVL